MNSIERAYEAFCTERFPLPTEEDVAELESRLGIPFPADFRDYLLKYNGGYFTEPEIIPATTDCPLDCLTAMYGIRAPDPTFEIASRASLLLFDENDPPKLLPIGDTMMGNLIFLVIDSEGDDRGFIGMKLSFSARSFLLGTAIEHFFSRLRKPTMS